MTVSRGPSDHNQRLTFSRRTLLRGAAAATVATAATAATAPGAGAVPFLSTVDYPGAEWLPAHPTNYRVGQRAASSQIKYVVIHVTDETFHDTVGVFQRPGSSTSAHYHLRSADGHIAQCVREKDVAWHATSPDHDDHGIGIAHEGWVNASAWFTEAMYASSATLTAALCARYAIPTDRNHILGHSEVSSEIHTDPGANWDWDQYLHLVRAHSTHWGGS